MNQIVIMGRLTKDPDFTKGKGKKVSYSRFGVAVNRTYDRDTADFFNCVAFDKLAEFTDKYLVKGTKILVTGELQNNNYEDKDGVTHYSNQLVARTIEFCESKKSANNEVDDELPFD